MVTRVATEAGVYNGRFVKGGQSYEDGKPAKDEKAKAAERKAAERAVTEAEASLAKASTDVEKQKASKALEDAKAALSALGAD